MTAKVCVGRKPCSQLRKYNFCWPGVQRPAPASPCDIGILGKLNFHLQNIFILTFNNNTLLSCLANLAFD